MRLKFLRDTQRKQLGEKKGSFSLPVFIIERSRAIEIVFLIAGADISAGGAVCQDQL